MSDVAPVDPSCCPLCRRPSACAMEVERATGIEQPPCWCTRVSFDHAVLDRVPSPARGRACICQACATRSPQAGAA